MKAITKAELFAQLGSLKSTQTLANNQVVINFCYGEVMQSYGKTIGVYTDNGKWYFDPHYHDYSATTSKYCTKWCGLSTPSRRRAVEKDPKHYQYLELN
ncbi:MAG: hypothetical protein IJ640_00075 [Prevotella sp.]|nr:hypothetical protein [Prevotella sp.]